MPMRISEAAARKLGIVAGPEKKRRVKATSTPYPTFEAMCAEHGLPAPEREYQFAPPRKWRFDFAWVAEKTAVEIDGGAWTGGRHTRGKGFVADQAKLNRAVVMGWRVLRVTPQDVESGEVFAMLKEIFEGMPEDHATEQA